MSTLVLVAQKAVARFLTHEAPRAPLRELELHEHPESALRNQELVTDGPGSVKERMGPQVRAASPQETPKHHEAEVFAREVASRLGELRLSNAYERAVVVAAPEFLGMLRAAMSDADRRFVTHEVSKNVATHDLEAIEAQLEDVLQLRGARVATMPLSREVRALLD